LWCRKRKVDDVVVLSVLPDRTPELPDVKRLAESLVRSCRVLRVVVDLSDLAFINSAMMAGLLLLRKQVLAAKGRLVLCGLSPHVQATFGRTRIDRLFEILDMTTDALSTLSSGTGSRHVRATRIEMPQVAGNHAKGDRPWRGQHSRSPTEKNRMAGALLAVRQHAGPGP
jgi:anti-anti-sigma factor